MLAGALGTALTLMLYASLAVAVDVPASKKNTKTIQGPIKITSQHADFDERDKRMLYRGNVLLVSQELELRGERLELRQPGTGLYEAHVTGRPARLNHAGAQGTPPLSARANQIVYNTQASTVALSGGVQLERGTDVLTGENIRYNAVSRRISASGANGGQVKIVIQPPARKEKKK